MKTVLVADDEFDLANTLRALLEAEGYAVRVCSNGKEALEQLRAEKPDLALMDVMMPYVSGFEVLRTMTQTPGLDGVPVVLMSSAPPGVKQGDYHWQAFLRKPFTVDALLKTIRGLV